MKATKQGMFRGNELPRLMTMLFMLVVLGMMFVRARDPDTWRWLVNDSGKTGTTNQAVPTESPKDISQNIAQSPSAVQNQPVYTEAAMQKQPVQPRAAVLQGPTDLDEEEVDAIEEEFRAISDGTLAAEIEDVIGAYPRLVRWTLNQAFAEMSRRARSDVSLGELIKNPQQYRGKLIKLDLNVARVRKYEDQDVRHLLKDDAKDVELYEVWGNVGDANQRLCEAVVVGLPPGMPVGNRVEQKATLVGYFFKIQGYESGDGKPGRAPWLIGRLSSSPLSSGDGKAENQSTLSPLPTDLRSRTGEDQKTLFPLPLGEGQKTLSPLPLGEGKGEGNLAEAKADFDAVSDGTMHPELPAYRRLLHWTLDQPFSALQQQARTDLAFTDLYLRPAEYRGSLIQLHMNVKMIVPIDEKEVQDLLGNEAKDNKLYEVWGNSSESKSRLYMAVVVGLPQEMPIGANLDEEVMLAGYFLKVLAYYAENDGKKWLAPMLVGRLQWQPPQQAHAEYWLSAIALGGFIIIAAGGWVVFLLKRSTRKPAAVAFQNIITDNLDNTSLAHWLQTGQSSVIKPGNLDDSPSQEG
jgi:hypothetical protein